MPSEFDWRIGILDQAPLYACKYYMAKDHWQIYDWASENTENFGASDAVPIENVPEVVIKTALKGLIVNRRRVVWSRLKNDKR